MSTETLTEMNFLTQSAKKMLTTFTERINTLAEHKTLVRELSDTLLTLKKEPDNKANNNLAKLILSRIKNDILPPFSLIDPRLNEHITMALRKTREEDFTDISQIEESTKGIASEPAKKRLKELQERYKQHAQKTSKQLTLTEHWQNITTLANQHARKQQELLARESQLIKETEATLGTYNDHKYDSLAHDWQIFIEEMDIILKEEREKIIKPIDFLFEENHSVASRIKQRLEKLKWKGRPTHEEISAVATRITEAEIAQDLEALTTHAEIHEYTATMMEHAHYLTPEARKYLSSRSEIKAKEAEEKEKRLTEEATTDSLTGLFNRKTIIEMINKELEKAKRTPTIFSILYIDIDHFKTFNDNYGHHIGDIVLKHTANIIMKNLRLGDTPGRLGGEELCAILPNTDIEGAVRVAEKVRNAIQTSSRGLLDGLNTQIKIKNPINEITISTGVANYPVDGKDAEELLNTADARLYKAKGSGRNKVVAE